MKTDGNKELVPCLLCGKGGADSVFQSPEVRIVRCRNCNFLYQNPRDLHIVDSDNSDNCYQSYINVAVSRKMLFSAKFDAFISDKKPGKILDIGFGAGHFLRVATERGWQPVGIDVAKSACDYLIKEGFSEVYNGTLEQVGFPDQAFDVVHMNHVLEHIHWPHDFLQEIYRILKPDGLLLLEVPNESIFPYNYRMINFFRPRHIPPRGSHKKHVSLFTTKTLRRFLLQNGFRPKVMRIEGFASSARLMTPIFQNKSLLVKTLLLLCRFQLDVKLGFGRYIVALAEKK